MSTRTKILIWVVVLLPIVVAVMAVILPKVIAYLFASSGSGDTVFVIVHFHPAPFAVSAALWALLLSSAIISFRLDKRPRDIR